MGLDVTKTVFGVSDKGILKPVSSATKTSLKIENLLDAGLDMILSYKRITNAPIRLRGCAGWSAPVLFENPEDRFPPVKTHMGGQWLSGRVLESRPRGCGFEPHRHHCVVSLSKTHLSLLSAGSTQEDLSQHN